MTRLTAVFLLTALIHFVDTLSYSVRPAGVRTGRLATAASLFNVIALGSRMANLVQAPLLGSLVDFAVVHDTAGRLESDFRLVLVAATMGAVLGALVIPTFVRVFARGIMAFEAAGSVGVLAWRVLRPRKLLSVTHDVRAPGLDIGRRLDWRGLPIGFLVLNVLITAIYTTGVLAALYAGALLPDFRTTATQLSGVINGFATVLFVLAVDPVAALITDQVLAGRRPRGQVNAMAALLAATKILGTVLAQLVLLPAAEVVVSVTSAIVR